MLCREQSLECVARSFCTRVCPVAAVAALSDRIFAKFEGERQPGCAQLIDNIFLPIKFCGKSDTGATKFITRWRVTYATGMRDTTGSGIARGPPCTVQNLLYPKNHRLPPNLKIETTTSCKRSRKASSSVSINRSFTKCNHPSPVSFL